ncbi:MAG: hypothetical protein IJ331_03155 [Ruminococcus sp.]|nr:hypothetical protein [Ruminococcus sp.]
MKRIICLILLCCMLVPLLSACDDSVGDSTVNRNSAYNFKTDYQYYYHGLLSGGLPIAKSETGYYFFLPTRFLYYIDKESLETTPLCNKVNCLHNDRDECDAFFNTFLVPSDIGGSFNIQYYDDSLYMLLRDEDEYGQFVGASFYKVSLDGVTREKLIEFDHGLSAWLVHRGYFYYTVEKYSDEIETMNVYDSFSIKRVPLDDLGAEPTEVFNSKEYSENTDNCDRLIAYGDYIYTAVDPVPQEIFEKFNETGKWYMSTDDIKLFSINVTDLSVNQLTNPDGEVNPPEFYNGKLLYSLRNSDDNSKLRYYTSELDGSNPVFIKEMELRDQLFCNEDQLYLENSLKNMVDEVSDDYDEIKILDSGLNVTSTFKIPHAFSIILRPQDADYFIMFQSIGNSDMEVHCIDKSKLDKMNGEEVEYKTVYSSLKDRPHSE